MAPPILTYRGLRLSLGDSVLFNGVDLAIEARERICLVGRNGSGKSTLLKILSGARDPDGGERFVQPGTRIAYMPQQPHVAGHATVLDYVVAGLGDDEQEHAYRAELLLDQLQISGTQALEGLSGGESRRAVLARALLVPPDILLLDEPTNHFDLPAIEWLEEELLGLRCAMVIISHDRAFLRRVTDKTWWIDRTILQKSERGFEFFDQWSDDVYAQAAKDKRELDKRIASETRWSHEGITARRKRNQGRLRRLQDMRQHRGSLIAKTGLAELKVEAGSTSGKMVLECEEISKSFAERRIVDRFSCRIQRGDRIGIIGPNGSGKTTLIRMMMGELEPDDGSVRMGTKLESLYLGQSRSLPDEAATLQDVLCPRGGDQVDVAGQNKHIAAFLKDFLFSPAQARSPVGSLSGGERSRLLLARAMCRPCNFMILDEPTNDLDMETLDLLVELLAEFDGTLIVVSHDRDFLNRVVSATLVFEGRGKITEYAGGYDDYLVQRKAAETVASTKVKSAKKTKDDAISAPTAGRLSYKFQRELDQLPASIARLETEIVTFEEKLADGDFYRKTPDQYAVVAERLATAKIDLETAEERWLELEEMREQAAQA
jgi:ATP-binding cassette subfamily F protein uup